MRKLTAAIRDGTQEGLQASDQLHPERKEAQRITIADANVCITTLKTSRTLGEALWAFINTNDPYTAAIPLLITSLPKRKDKVNKGIIIDVA